MKTFEGEKGNGMTERNIRRFLTQSRSTLLLGTINDDGAPIIHPVWYYFDSAKTRLYFYTEPALRKAKNIKKRILSYARPTGHITRIARMVAITASIDIGR